MAATTAAAPAAIFEWRCSLCRLLSPAFHGSMPVSSFGFNLRHRLLMAGRDQRRRADAGRARPRAAPPLAAADGFPAVAFPSDYSELLQQAKEATESALNDGKKLLEIDFPTSGLESVPGDGEGGIEMTESMLLIREFCDRLVPPEKATRTRIFFPEANEVAFARESAFSGSLLKLDYLTKPSLFEDFGFVSKVRMADRVQPNDELFLVAYPYFNVNEMLTVAELYSEAVDSTDRKLIIFNGELDRIRSGYYPAFFYPKLASLSKTLFPKLETVYYVHNFKGAKGGTLFRRYPGPWTVLRKVRDTYVCVHQQEDMPSLKEVALSILPSV